MKSGSLLCCSRDIINMTDSIVVVVVVDPVSTGASLLNEIARRGYRVAALWSSQMRGSSSDEASAGNFDEQACLSSTGDLLAGSLPSLPVAIVCGGDSGVVLADTLSEHFGLRTNGSSANRRDKHWQQIAIAAAGLRRTQCVHGMHWMDEMNDVPMPVVVKLAEGTGSEGVRLCHAAEDAKLHVEYLLDAQRSICSMGKASARSAVLVQEFLPGTEYVVDTASRDGEHKVVLLWRYDKRSANGKEFVYFGESPLDSSSAEAKVLIPYALAVLAALGVVHGPAHTEIVLTPSENGTLSPCLVEVNCRCHGGSGLWVPLAERLCDGISQVSAAADAYLDANAFTALPRLPASPYHRHGAFVCLVSHMDAQKVIGTPGYDRIENLKSFVAINRMVSLGAQLRKTVDLFTVAGMVILVHESEAAVQQDVAFIRDLEVRNEIFEVSAAAEDQKPVIRIQRKKIGFASQ